MDCIFCKITKGEIPSYKLFENDDLIAILDISQATKGHTLIIPKKHYKNLYELEENLASNIFKIVPKLANALKKAFNPIGLNVLINTEKPLQTVDHFHIHLIPRYEDDKLEIEFENNYGKISKESFVEIQNLIINNL
jgi:histidine triad (HIT) family protein